MAAGADTGGLALKKFEQTTQSPPPQAQRNTPFSRPLINAAMTTRPLGMPPPRRNRGKVITLTIVGGALLVSALIVLMSSGLGAALLGGSRAKPPAAAPASVVGHV